jgi:hypothetical protein
VTIQGQGFTQASLLSLDDVPCENLTTLSSVEMSCITPDLSGQGLDSRTARFQLLRVDDGQEAQLDFELSADVGKDSGTVDSADPDSGGGGDTGVEPEEEEAVDYCHIQWPCSLSSIAGESTDTVYIWVYEAGATDGSGQGQGIEVEVGYGPDGATEMDHFSWTEAIYFTDKDGLMEGDLANDEYAGSVQPETPATYDLCARVSADSGFSWTLCDLGGDGCSGAGSSDGYSPDDSVPLVVESSIR